MGYWKLDALQGGNLVDASGQNNDGLAQGDPQLIAGSLDDGLHLDGSGDYVVVADDPSLDINQQITLSAWIQPESRKTQYVIKKADHDKVDGFELSLSGSGKVFARFNQDSAGNAYRVNSTSSYPTNGSLGACGSHLRWGKNQTVRQRAIGELRIGQLPNRQ